MDRLDLVFGHQIAPGLVEPDLARHRVGDFLMVARDHDHAANAQFSELRERDPGGLARRVHQADGAQVPVPLPNDHGGPAIVPQGRDRFLHRAGQGGDAL